MIDNCGATQFSGLTDALQSSCATTSVRVNPLKRVHLPPDADAVAWCDYGMYLPSRVPFTFDPAMHQGLYYVQEASSMFLSEALRQVLAQYFPGTSAVNYLDACAAPGGKTACAAFTLPPASTIVANELSPARCDVLVENLQKAGIDNAIVTCADARAFANIGRVFDIIAVDAPCSGEGMMRKEPMAVEQWSPSLVDTCAATQRMITDALWHALRPGGVMIYSTCTFNPHENEEIVRHLIEKHGAQPLKLHLADEWKIQPSLDPEIPACRFIPGTTRGEGLFMAVVRKPGEYAPATVAMPRRPTHSFFTTVPTLATTTPARWLLAQEEERCWLVNKQRKAPTLNAIDSRHMPMLQTLAANHIAPVNFGIEAAIQKGRDYIPSQALALSNKLDIGAFATCDVDAGTALAFLRGESLTLPDSAPRGIVMLTYLGHPLGPVKNLGNRANNNYPHKWRVVTPQNPYTLLTKQWL